MTGNSRVPASEKRHLQFFCVFLNALLCGPWGLGFGLPRSGFASGAFRFHLDSFDDLIDARLVLGDLELEVVLLTILRLFLLRFLEVDRL